MTPDQRNQRENSGSAGLLVLAGINYLLFRTGIWLNGFGGSIDQAGAWLCWAAFIAGFILAALAAVSWHRRKGPYAYLGFLGFLPFLAILWELFIA